MNLVAFGLILICCHAWAIETNGYLENEYDKFESENTDFENFLVRLQGILKEGNDTLGIPLLDPFFQEELPIQIDKEIIEPLFDLDALLKNFNVNGLSNYAINKGSFYGMPPIIIADLTWPLVTVSTKYDDLKGKIGYYKVYGSNGNMEISAENLKFVTEISFTFNVTNIKPIAVETQLSLEKLHFRADGFFDDKDLSKLMSYVISDTMPQLIQDNQEIITQKLNIIVMNVIDSFTSAFTFREIMDIIGLGGAVP